MALKNNKYQPTYVEGIRRYFFDYELDEDNKGIPQMSAYARKLGVTVRTLENWAKKHKAFGEAYEACLDKQQELLINGGLVGSFNPKIVQFLLEARSQREKKEAKTEIVVRYEKPDDHSEDTEGASYGA